MPSAEETLVFIVVDGKQFDFFTQYNCGSSIFEADSPFSFHAPVISVKELKEVNGIILAPGKVVEVYVRVPSARPMAVRQYVGIIKTVEEHVDHHGGSTLTITGRNHLSPIVDCDVMPGFALENVTFADLIKKVLIQPCIGQPNGFYSSKQIQVNGDACRALLTGNPAAGTTLTKKAPPELEVLKVDQAKPHAGETIFHYLHRHATRMGLMMWGTPDGKIVFGRPAYDQKPLYEVMLRRGEPERTKNNNVVQWNRRRSFEHRGSEYHVYGHSFGGDQMRSPIHAVVYDEEIRKAGIFCPITVHDNNARTIAQAEQRARLELSKRLMSADEINVIMEGHGSNGSIWAMDTVVSVSMDDDSLVNDNRYVVARTFSRSMSGTHTMVHIVPKNSIVFGDIQYIPPKRPAGVSVTGTYKADNDFENIMSVIAKKAGEGGGRVQDLGTIAGLGVTPKNDDSVFRDDFIEAAFREDRK